MKIIHSKQRRYTMSGGPDKRCAGHSLFLGWETNFTDVHKNVSEGKMTKAESEGKILATMTNKKFPGLVVEERRTHSNNPKADVREYSFVLNGNIHASFVPQRLKYPQIKIRFREIMDSLGFNEPSLI